MFGLLAGTPCWPPRLKVWPGGLVKCVPRASRRNSWASRGPPGSKNCPLATVQIFALTYWCADQGQRGWLHLKFLGFTSETCNMALVLHTLDCAKWMPRNHDMHHCTRSSRNAVVCGKQLTALVLWSHIWDNFAQYVTPRTVAREQSKIIAYFVSSTESQREELYFIEFELRVVKNMWWDTFTTILGSDTEIRWRQSRIFPECNSTKAVKAANTNW